MADILRFAQNVSYRTLCQFFGMPVALGEFGNRVFLALRNYIHAIRFSRLQSEIAAHDISSRLRRDRMFASLDCLLVE